MTSYCSDSIERYFRSLDQSTTTPTITAGDDDVSYGAVTTSPTITAGDDGVSYSAVTTSPTITAGDGGVSYSAATTTPTITAGDDDDVSYSAGVKQLFRARVASMKRSLLHSANNDHVTSDDLDPCDDVTGGHEVNWEECEDDAPARETGLSDDVRCQLMIDVRDSVDTCHETTHHVTTHHVTSHHAAASGCEVDVGESLTFDYLDDSPLARHCLPAHLRDELKLDLRHSQTADDVDDDVTVHQLNETTHDDHDDDVVDDSLTSSQHHDVINDDAARRVQSSGVYRKSTAPVSDDVLKPVPSKARPQTAAAVTRSRSVKSSKKTVAWSEDTSHEQQQSNSKPRHRPFSAHVLDGRHIGTASANQRPASSSADHW